ncbi:MAG: hypothetical protein U9O94_00070 [Nanoarchaeota archaeon]|nr:hypothetical protein [Nanoarchaeota archaeon]
MGNGKTDERKEKDPYETLDLLINSFISATREEFVPLHSFALSKIIEAYEHITPSVDTEEVEKRRNNSNELHKTSYWKEKKEKYVKLIINPQYKKEDLPLTGQKFYISLGDRKKAKSLLSRCTHLGAEVRLVRKLPSRSFQTKNKGWVYVSDRNVDDFIWQHDFYLNLFVPKGSLDRIRGMQDVARVERFVNNLNIEKSLKDYAINAVTDLVIEAGTHHDKYKRKQDMQIPIYKWKSGGKYLPIR